MKKSWGWGLITSAILMATTSYVNAGVIYDNLVAQTYDAATGDTISTSASVLGFDASFGQSFAAVATADLKDVQIAMWNVAGSNGFNLVLTDSASNVLESWSDVAAPTGASGIPVVTLNSALNPHLTAGSAYTLTATATGTTWDAWEVSGNASLSPGIPAFRVEGNDVSSVPEPGSLTALGLGLAGVVGLGWMKKRKAKPIAA
jgi:hypothetical protein